MRLQDFFTDSHGLHWHLKDRKAPMAAQVRELWEMEAYASIVEAQFSFLQARTTPSGVSWLYHARQSLNGYKKQSQGLVYVGLSIVWNRLYTGETLRYAAYRSHSKIAICNDLSQGKLEVSSGGIRLMVPSDPDPVLFGNVYMQVGD